MADMFAPADPYSLDAQRITRARKFAEALQQQGTTAIDPNRMAGGWVVPIQKGEGLSKIAQALLGAYAGQKQDEKERILGDKYRADTTADFSALANALKGSPARAAVPMPSDDIGGGPGREAMAAIPQGQLDESTLSSLRTPQAQQTAMALLMQQYAPKTLIKKSADEGLYTPQGKEVVPATPKPEFGTTPHYEMGADGKPVAVLFDKNGNKKMVPGTPMNQFTTPTVDSQNRLAQAQQHWNGLSADQQAQIKQRAQALGVSVAELMFNTGSAPANVPVPQVGASQPIAPQAQPAPNAVQPTPQNFPRVTPQVQQGRNAEQVAILTNELQNEQNPQNRAVIQAEIAKLSGAPFAAAGGNPLSPAAPGLPPKFQAQVDTHLANQRGELAQKREFNMGGLLDSTAQARAILSGGNPTASGVGNALDKAAAVVGVAPRGAAEADQLRAIAGVLTAKMPRMEGPQSDRDVQLYKEMAGQIGDAGLPVERRIAALNTIESLHAKYDKQSTAVPGERRAADRRGSGNAALEAALSKYK